MGLYQRSSVLVAADAHGSDQFGSGVALSSNGLVMAVGAKWYSTTGNIEGGVYLYDWSGSAWVQRGSVLLASDLEYADGFGSAVALSDDGSVLCVGAPGWDSSVGNEGAVYLYDWSGTAWVQRGSVLTAADATASDNFGSGVALSSDAAILAVGAYGWEGAASEQGGVYLYDWSGTAWVQRGSVLTAADAASTDYFGISVALSATGTTLAVGANRWEEGATTDQGGVYLYDWSGSAWVQRGSVLAASDLAIADYYGWSVALSGDAAVLAVGAFNWESTGSTRGAIYLYDWSGTAWVERGIYVPADAEDNDNFGSAVALSGDAAIVAVGASGWEGALTNQGGVYVFDWFVPQSGVAEAPTSLTVEIPTGTASAATDLAMTSTGDASAATDLTMTAVGAASAATTLTTTWPTGIASAATALTVSGSGAASAPTALAVTGTTHAPLWTSRCVIDGADVSAQLIGTATVDAEEGAARIARIALLPLPGVIAPLDYVGRTITLDYVQVIDGTEVPRRLFTGRIDKPDYDPASTILTLSCTDDLQNRVASLDRSVIDSLINGRYTEAVQGEIDDNWDYAQAVLSTVAASLDAGPAGGMRVTPWHLDSTWATYTDADLIYESARLTLPQRSTLVNKVSVSYEYRYPRLRQRYTSVGWSGTQIDMAPNGWAYPTQQDIAGAAGGSGWTVTLGVYWPAPAAIPHSSGGFIYPPDGSIDMAIVHLTQRHSQTVTESYAITVTAPESIDANGEIPQAIRGALSSTFDGQAWEAALDVLPLLPEGGGEMDYAPDATRADSDYALQTLLDQANVKILGSHRSARVGNAVLCNPDLDLDKHVVIATTGMDASGKVARVSHTLDFAAGSAVSEFDLAIFGVGGVGIITPDTLDPPPAPEEATETQDWESGVSTLQVNTYGVTPYQEDLCGLLLNPPETITVEDVPDVGSMTFDNPYYTAGAYPQTGFRVRMPGVDDADRNPLSKPVEQSYQLVIPSDTLTFTVP